MIAKNKSNDIHIYTASFAERRLVHVRIFYRENPDAVSKPSPKGVAFDESVLGRIIDGIERAQKEVANISEVGAPVENK